MSISKIIDEIDSYLLFLRTARDLLSAASKEEPLDLSPSKRRRLALSGIESAPALKKPSLRQKSRLLDPGPEVKAKAGRRKSANHLPGAATPRAAAGEQKEPITVAVNISPRALDERALTQPRAAVPMQRARRLREVIHKEQGATGPAIALAQGLKDRVVVVSAEQVRRQREEAARPPAPRPRVLTYGSKSAFDALFKDEATNS